MSEFSLELIKKPFGLKTLLDRMRRMIGTPITNTGA